MIVQEAPAATATDVQLLVCEKSSVAITLLIVRGAVPVLVTVIGDAVLVVPTSTPAKLRLRGDRVAAGATPVPLIAALCGLPAALSVILTVDDRLPVLLGVNVTLIVQLAFAASEPGQLLVCEKSPELPLDILMLVTDSEAFPALLSVIDCGVLAMPACWLPKLRLAGDRFTTACACSSVEHAKTEKRQTYRDGVRILRVTWNRHERGMLSVPAVRLFCAYELLKSRKKSEELAPRKAVCKFLHDLVLCVENIQNRRARDSFAMNDSDAYCRCAEAPAAISRKALTNPAAA